MTLAKFFLLLSASRQKSLIEGFYNYTSGCSATFLGGVGGKQSSFLTGPLLTNQAENSLRPRRPCDVQLNTQ